jgi:sulfite exporter TauE/SafE/copper chaperone CopZ
MADIKYNCEFYVEGMHCAACELLIEKKLSKFVGVRKVNAKLNESKVYIEAEQKFSAEELCKLVENEGYRIVENKETIKKFEKKNLILGFLISIVFFTVFLLLQKAGIINLASGDGQITLPFVFTVGIVASLSTCMAVVGGLVLSLSSNYAKENQAKPMLTFHISRIVGFFILGGLIGLLGSAFDLTPVMSFILNFVLFIVMLIMAINLLDVFPIVKKLQLRMPKFIGKRAMNVGESKNFFTPILLGAVTFFLPCGFTQSMQLYSLTTGSFLNGALTMLVFALGTLPILALISIASSKFSKGLQSSLFFKTAGFIIIFFAIFNFTAALAAIGIIKPIFNI